MAEKLDALAVALLRSQRHSYMNHLQVISGWLQMGRPERARQYLDALSSRVAAESEAMRQASPALGLFLIETGLEAETYGVTVNWRLHGPEASLRAPTLARLRARVLEAVRSASALAADLRTVAVIIGPGDRFEVHTASASGEG